MGKIEESDKITSYTNGDDSSDDHSSCEKHSRREEDCNCEKHSKCEEDWNCEKPSRCEEDCNCDEDWLDHKCQQEIFLQKIWFLLKNLKKDILEIEKKLDNPCYGLEEIKEEVEKYREYGE